MNEKRVKSLLFNALLKFADDEYEKESVLEEIDMSEEEFEELMKEFNDEIYFIEY